MQRVYSRLHQNGYDTQWIQDVERKMDKDKNRSRTNYANKVRMLLPYKSEEVDRLVRNIIRRNGLPISIVYPIKPKTLERQLTRSRTTTRDCPYKIDQQQRQTKRIRGRPKKPCIVCAGAAIEPDGLCQRKNVVYGFKCTLCQEDYVGETERQLSQRIPEHEADGRHQRELTPVGKHYRDHHPSQEVSFNDVRILAVNVPDAVSRQIQEAIEIRDTTPSINISRGYKLL